MITKQEIMKVIHKHKWEPLETWISCDIISEEEFDSLAENLVELFKNKCNIKE